MTTVSTCSGIVRDRLSEHEQHRSPGHEHRLPLSAPQAPVAQSSRRAAERSQQTHHKPSWIRGQPADPAACEGDVRLDEDGRRLPADPLPQPGEDRAARVVVATAYNLIGPSRLSIQMAALAKAD